MDSFEATQSKDQSDSNKMPEYLRNFSETMKFLSVLMKKSDKIAPEVMEDLAKHSRYITKAIKTVLVPEIVKEVEEEEKLSEKEDRKTNARESFSSIRRIDTTEYDIKLPLAIKGTGGLYFSNPI